MKKVNLQFTIKMKAVMYVQNSIDKHGEYIIASRDDITPLKTMEDEVDDLCKHVKKPLGLFLSIMTPSFKNSNLIFNIPNKSIRIYDERDEEKYWVDMPYSRVLRYDDVLDFLTTFWDILPPLQYISFVNSKGVSREGSHRLEGNIKYIRLLKDRLIVM